MNRTEWYYQEKQTLHTANLDQDAKEYIGSLLIRAMNECGTI